MANKTNEDFYYNLSRKELQSLCKKYGLPANRSHSELATLLISYLENKNLNSISSVEGLGGINETLPPTSSIPQLKPGAELDPAGDADKDGHGFILCLREEEKKGNYSQSTKSNDSACCFGAKYHDKDCLGGSICNLPEMSQSNIVFQCNHKESLRESFNNTYLDFLRDGIEENMPLIKGRNIDVGACPVENAIASSTKAFPRVSSTSFEFHVMSEEGINLHVDLNSSPSDWAKRFKNEVHICEGVHRNNSQSFHQGLEHFAESDKQVKSTFIWNMDSGQINYSHVLTTFSPSSEMTETDQMGFEQPDKGDASLLSCAIMPCSMAIDVSENLKKDEVLISSEPNSNTQDQVNSAADTCAKDRCTVILDSDATDTPQLKSACNSVVNSMSDGPPSPLQLKDQNSKCGDEIFENSTLQNSCSLVNPSLVYPGSSASGSMDLPVSEVASCHKDASCSHGGNVGFLDLADPKHNIDLEQGRLANSSEIDHETYRNLLPTCVEEWERSNIINGRESSECSQVDNSVGRTCLSSNDMKSKELHKKRKHGYGQDQSSYDKPDTKILRSSRHIARKVLPRRSMRLIAKDFET